MSISALFGLFFLLKILYFFIVTCLKCFGFIPWDDEEKKEENKDDEKLHNEMNGSHSLQMDEEIQKEKSNNKKNSKEKLSKKEKEK